MSITAFCIVLALGAPSDGTDAGWPHLRGPDQNGHVASSVFESGEFGLAETWKSALGSAYSSVVVVDGTLVTMANGGEQDVVIALDAGTGDERWRFPIGEAYLGHDGSEDGAISTPLVYRGRVYALSARGRLVALDASSGELVWSHDLVADYGATPPDYGFSTTPVADGDLIILQIGGSERHALGAFDAATGELRWSIGDESVDYQSPVIMTLAGERQLVVFRGGQVLAGHDPQSGTPLWEHELGPRDGAGSSIPIPIDEHHFAAIVRSGLIVYELKDAVDGFKLEEKMRSRDLGGTYAPPVKFGDHFYGFRRDFLTCVDAKTGKRVWRSRPPGGKGLLLVNDRLVIFGAHGRVVVAPASPEGYEEEASLQVFDGSAFTWPAFAGGRIYVRNPSHIAAVEVVAGSGTGTGAAVASAGIDSPFTRFIAGLGDASDKQARIDAYLGELETYPLIEDDVVHFLYRGEVRDVAMASPIIDASRPAPLTHVDGTDLYYSSYRVEPGTRVEYQFQVDFDRWETDSRNPHTVPGRSGELSEVLMPGYQRAEHTDPPTGDRRGRTETFTFDVPDSDQKREITVYLPHAYDAEPRRRFPVLIVQDGPSWLEKGLMVNTLDNLIGRSVEPVVVVFLDTIGMWWLEAGGSETAQFADMLAGSFVPELERRYRLRDDAAARAIMGNRDYGLSAAYAGITHPDVFGKVAVQSVAMQNGAQHELFELLEQQRDDDRADLDFYVDWNLYESRSADGGFDFKAETRSLVAALERAGYPCRGGEARDSHGWAGWRARSDDILEGFFPLGR